MATHSIAGNVGAGTVGEIVYINSVGGYPPLQQPNPQTTVADSSKNYSFTGLTDGVYNLYTAAAPLAVQQVVLSGNNIIDVNFAK